MRQMWRQNRRDGEEESEGRADEQIRLTANLCGGDRPHFAVGTHAAGYEAEKLRRAGRHPSTEHGWVGGS